MSHTVEREILFHIREAWRHVNYQAFSSQMRAPMFELIDQQGILGRWCPTRRMISIQRQLVMTSPWLDVVEVLKHEMAHQYIHEICGNVDEGPHGPTFQEICRERGICAATSGKIEHSPEVERLLKKVEKLLSLAQSDNAHEAEVAAQRARELLARHHIALNQVDEESERWDHLGSSMNYMQLGEPKGRWYQYEYALVNLLTQHFFVSAVWVTAFDVKQLKSGRVAELCGRAEDLEIASYVYDFINTHLDFAWKTYRRQRGAKGIKTRLSFSLGLIQGFSTQLTREDTRLEPEERALVLKSSARAERFLEARHQHLRSRSSSGWSPSQDYFKGFEEGEQLRLRRGVHSQGQSHTPAQLSYSK